MQTNFVKVLNELYSEAGLAGFYRGIVPRSIHLFPILMSGNYVLDALETMPGKGKTD